MAKTLVIKGANFSAVALDQVEFEQDIPCTGISLSPSSLTFDEVGEQKTLTAMLTPANTTDTLLWASSNENVATVSGGAVTIHGIGTAIITATCGNQSASVTITQTSLIVSNIVTLTGKYPDKLSTATPALQMVTGNIAVGQEYIAADTDLHVRNAAEAIQAIRVPFGASQATLHASDGTTYAAGQFVQADPAQRVVYNSKDWPKVIDISTSSNMLSGKTVTAGYCVMYKFASSITATFDYVIFD